METDENGLSGCGYLALVLGCIGVIGFLLVAMSAGQ